MKKMRISVATWCAFLLRENPIPGVFPAKQPPFFFLPPSEGSGNLHYGPGRIKTRKNRRGPEFFRGGEIASWSLLAPSGEKSNSNFNMAQISPLGKPENLAYLFGGTASCSVAGAPWQKCKFELRPGTHSAAEKPRNPGVFFFGGETAIWSFSSL